jgi:inner membrane protein
MATPIGHCLAGYAVRDFTSGRQGSRLPTLLLAVAMANAPDLDFLPGLFVGMPALYHQGITHSLGFGFVASVLGALAFRLCGQTFGVTFRICLLAYVSHLALDFFGPDGRPPFGQPILWPLSDEYFRGPVSVFPGVRHAASTSASTREWVGTILSASNLGAIAVEIVVIGPVAYYAWCRRRSAVLARAER